MDGRNTLMTNNGRRWTLRVAFRGDLLCGAIFCGLKNIDRGRTESEDHLTNNKHKLGYLVGGWEVTQTILLHGMQHAMRNRSHKCAKQFLVAKRGRSGEQQGRRREFVFDVS